MTNVISGLPKLEPVPVDETMEAIIRIRDDYERFYNRAIDFHKATPVSFKVWLSNRTVGIARWDEVFE